MEQTKKGGDTIEPFTILVTAAVMLIGGAVYRDTQRQADDIAAHAAKSILEKPIITLTPTHILTAAAAAYWMKNRHGT